MFLTNPFPHAFGLDIGDLSIKLMRLEPRFTPNKKGGFVVHEQRSIALPPGYIVNGEIQQPEMVRKKILQLLQKTSTSHAITSPWVVADLPGPKTFLKLITMETSPANITADDVEFYARKHVPFELDETYLDWQVISNPDQDLNQSEVLIAAVPKIIADSYTYLLESAGLSPIALEVEDISIARALITDSKTYEGEARALLDLGATRSGLTIYDKNSIQFSTTLHFSGELLTTALSQGLKIDYATAEKLKVSLGASYSKEEPRYLKIVSDLLDSLVNEIKLNLDFYKDHFADTNPITRIVLSGGSANLINVSEVLSQKLHVTAHYGNVWKNIHTENVDERKQRAGLSWASAIGLSLKAVQNFSKRTS